MLLHLMVRFIPKLVICYQETSGTLAFQIRMIIVIRIQLALPHLVQHTYQLELETTMATTMVIQMAVEIIMNVKSRHKSFQRAVGNAGNVPMTAGRGRKIMFVGNAARQSQDLTFSFPKQFLPFMLMVALLVDLHRALLLKSKMSQG